MDLETKHVHTIVNHDEGTIETRTTKTFALDSVDEDCTCCSGVTGVTIDYTTGPVPMDYAVNHVEHEITMEEMARRVLDDDTAR